MRHSLRTLLAGAGLLLASGAALAEAPEAYIISPAHGETVTSPVTVKFGLKGMGVAPAGVEQKNAGHHHLLIDLEKDELPDMDKPIPSDEQHVHFGGGQTETTVELEPGEHTLRMLVGDHSHIPHDEPVLSKPITIKVK